MARNDHSYSLLSGEEAMEERREQSRLLDELLRLQTRPVAVKLMPPGEKLPSRVRRPSRLLRHRVTVCQAITMVRRYGWRLGLLKEDVCCPVALIAYGWLEQPPDISEVEEVMLASGYAENREAARRQIEAIPRLTEGECGALLLAPLELTEWEPDLVVIYANPAQVMRLVHAATYHEGEPIQNSFGARAGSCAEGIIRTYHTKKCQVVLPGGGDRIFAMTGDDELCCTVPAVMLDRVLEGLHSSGRQVGLAYPIPVYQLFEPRFPRTYDKLISSIT
jgi:uncharacterized protein (DUF169 family)